MTLVLNHSLTAEQRVARATVAVMNEDRYIVLAGAIMAAHIAFTNTYIRGGGSMTVTLR